MRRVKEYVDGSVDLATGVAITENGVTSFKHPKLAYLAEKTGYVALGVFNRLSSLRPVAYLDAEGRAKIAEQTVWRPSTVRCVGSVVLALGLSAGVMSQAHELVGLSVTSIEAANNFLDDHVVEPWSQLANGGN